MFDAMTDPSRPVYDMNGYGTEALDIAVALEWQLPTPVPVHNFDQVPVIDSDPYDYGTPPPPTRPVKAPAEAAG
jgi:heme/copper-type cytochrome/quinol oxidase subunit 1